MHGSLNNSCTIRLCNAPVSDSGAASDIVRHMNLDCRPALYVHEPGSRILTLALRRWIADYNGEISVHCRFSLLFRSPLFLAFNQLRVNRLRNGSRELLINSKPGWHGPVLNRHDQTHAVLFCVDRYRQKGMLANMLKTARASVTAALKRSLDQRGGRGKRNWRTTQSVVRQCSGSGTQQIRLAPRSARTSLVKVSCPARRAARVGSGNGVAVGG